MQENFILRDSVICDYSDRLLGRGSSASGSALSCRGRNLSSPPRPPRAGRKEPARTTPPGRGINIPADPHNLDAPGTAWLHAGHGYAIGRLDAPEEASAINRSVRRRI